MSLCSEMPQLVIIDEIGIPRMSNRESMRILKEMRKLAEVTDATILILSNTSRLADERKEHMPCLSDFPVPVNMADVVIRMYREGYYNVENNGDEYDPTHLILRDNNSLFQEMTSLNYVVDSCRFVSIPAVY